MSPKWRRTIFFALALLPGLILAALSAWIFVDRIEEWGEVHPYAPSLGSGSPPERLSTGEMAVLISALTFLVSTLGTFSTVWLAWRNEGRQTREFTLKITQLELELVEMRRKSADPDAAVTSGPPVANPAEAR